MLLNNFMQCKHNAQGYAPHTHTCLCTVGIGLRVHELSHAYGAHKMIMRIVRGAGCHQVATVEH